MVGQVAIALLLAAWFLVWLVADQQRQSQARLVKPRSLGPSWAPNGISTIQLCIEDRIGLDQWLAILEPECRVYYHGVRLHKGNMQAAMVNWVIQTNKMHLAKNDPITIQFAKGGW